MSPHQPHPQLLPRSKAVSPHPHDHSVLRNEGVSGHTAHQDNKTLKSSTVPATLSFSILRMWCNRRTDGQVDLYLVPFLAILTLTFKTAIPRGPASPNYNLLVCCSSLPTLLSSQQFGFLVPTHTTEGLHLGCLLWFGFAGPSAQLGSDSLPLLVSEFHFYSTPVLVNLRGHSLPYLPLIACFTISVPLHHTTTSLFLTGA